MNQEQIKEEKSTIFTLLLSSILLHMLLILAIIFYRLRPEPLQKIKSLSPQDQVILWTNPAAKAIPAQAQPPVSPKQQPQQEQKSQQEEKKEPDAAYFKKAPIITPGNQGIDEQYTMGSKHSIQTTQGKILEEKIETINNISDEKKLPEKKIEDSKRVSEQKIFDANSQKGRSICKPDEEVKVPSINNSAQQNEKQRLKFDTNLKMFAKAKPISPKNVSQVMQKNSVKAISFKDIGLGFNNAATNIGNSQHLMIQGTSPDVPEGEELRYITYISQLANMIVNSMHANPQIKSLPYRTNEKIICFMKVDRSGKLLDVQLITRSKHDIVNIFILQSITNVGLFTAIPKFILKDTFEINWHILT